MAFKGKDQFGNEYFENKDYPYGRSRWIEVGDFSKWETFDSSRVPAEWHSWLHFMSDETPHDMKDPMVQKWRIEHEANKTGTSEAYMGPEYLLRKHDRKTGGVKPVHTEDGGIAYRPKSMTWDPNKDVEAEIKAEPNKEFKSFIESQKQRS